jgi:hypothetical protein
MRELPHTRRFEFASFDQAVRAVESEPGVLEPARDVVDGGGR